MLGISYGEDYNYAGSRLNSSLVRWGRHPFIVENISTSGIVLGLDTSTNEHSEVILSELDLSPVPLGYVNCAGKGEGSVSFCSRKPTRYYKQGLTNATLNSSRVKLGVSYPSLGKTILGEFKKVKQCFELLICKEVQSIAFSRNFCLTHLDNKDWSCKLLFREIPVGVVKWNPHGDNANYHLDKNRDFLKEILEEDINV